MRWSIYEVAKLGGKMFGSSICSKYLSAPFKIALKFFCFSDRLKIGVTPGFFAFMGELTLVTDLDSQKVGSI